MISIVKDSLSRKTWSDLDSSPILPANLICSTYSHNFLTIPDAAGKNKIFNKTKELGRIQDRRGLSVILLIVTAVSNMIPITWWVLGGLLQDNRGQATFI